MFEAGKVLIRSVQYRLNAIPVHHFGAVDLRLEYETLSVHQDVALATLDLLSTVVAALFSSHAGTLERLAIDDASAGLRVPLQANAQTFSDSPVDPFPSAIDAPFSEVVVNGGPSRKVVGE
jgi:hypothetical protein